MRFEIYRDKAEEYRWRLVAANGKVLADSGEGYKNEGDCLSAIQAVRGCAVAPLHKV